MKISDLKFGDIDKEPIAINNIDTTFLISDNEILNFGESDTFGYRTYDKEGNLLIERITKLGGHYVEYEYDSIGFVKYKNFSTDFSAKFWSTYKFITDSLMFYQYWTGSDTDTCVFKFNESGKVVQATEYANDDCARGAHTNTIYKYNDSGLLHEKTVYLLVPKEWEREYELIYGEGLSTKNITNFFYTDKKLDSAITAFYFPKHENQNYNSKTYYNSNGLRNRTVERDSIITSYAYKARSK